MSPIENILGRLQGVKQTGPQQWEARCPAHDDRRASLSLSTGHDGRVLLTCHAGCSTDHVVANAGLSLKDLFPSNGDGQQAVKKHRRITAEYVYQDEHGAELYRVCRYAPKDFRQCKPGPGGKRIWKTSGTRKVTYRLPELLEAAMSGGVAFVCEGEKDCDALVRCGFTATCNPGGAGKWKPSYNDHFKGLRQVVIVADADQAGRLHAQQVASALSNVVPEIKVIEMPDAKDAAAWLDNGGTPGGLLSLVEQAPRWKPLERETPSTDEIAPTIFDNHTSDLGLARRFVRLHNKSIKYCHEIGWLTWDGKRLQPSDSLGQLPQDVLNDIHREISHEQNQHRRKELAEWVARCEARAKLDNMIELASRQDEIRVPLDQLDQHPNLLNAANAIVDLETGERIPHDPKLLITQLAPVDFDPEASAPRFREFISDIMLGRQELIDFLQVLFGYCATGYATAQKFVTFHGDGSNGKSTLLSIVRRVLGDYAQDVDADVLMKSNRHEGRALAEIAQCRSKRLVTAVESDASAELNEGRVKQLSGGDPMVGKFYYKDPFTFTPMFTVILSTNDKPFIRGRKHATWRRICLVPFDWRVPPDIKDEHFAEKLIEQEAPGILTWIVQGAIRWFAEGLNPPDIVQEATEEYRSDTDILGDFFRDKCFLSDRAEVQSTPLYEAYKSWCEKAGEKPKSHTKLGRLLDERGFKKDPRKDANYYLGIGLKETQQGDLYGS